MRTLIVFVAVAVLSILASNQRLRQAGRFFNLAQLATSGMVFLVFGALLGPGGLDLLVRADLKAARPLLALCLGVAGLLLGLSLEPKLLRALPSRAWAAASIQSGLAAVAVAVPLAVLFLVNHHVAPYVAIGSGVLLGGSASVSSSHLAVLWHRAGRLERVRGLSIALLAMLDDLMGVVALAFALVVASSVAVWIGAGLVALALLLGAVCGALTAYLIHDTTEKAELTAILLGAVGLVSGVAAFLNVSTLLSGVACGATLALVGGSKVEAAYRALARTERPVYLVLLFLVGAQVNPMDLHAWLFVPAFVSLRFLGKIFGGRFAARTMAGALPLPRELGYALISQGGVAICVLAEFLVLVGGHPAQEILDIGVIGVIVNEALGARLFHRSIHVGDRIAPDLSPGVST